jgi:hypothetical protein
MQYIRKVTLSALDQYPTSIEEDSKILQEQELTYNQRNMVLFRR